MKSFITAADLEKFAEYLRHEEKSVNTVQKYIHDVRAFAAWLGERPITKEAVTAWREHLFSIGRAVISINSSIAALHTYFNFIGRNDCRVKYLKRQKRLFVESSHELGKGDYKKLVDAAVSSKNTRLALLLETICSTGIRVSEVKFITVEAVKKGQTTISMKGKIRVILIPDKLAGKLLKYAQKTKNTSGEIFKSKNGRSLSRCQIWSEMKKICVIAGVEKKKVYPHALRHLFARAFYSVSQDIVKLSNVLGHSSIETTRIYLITTHEEHIRELNRLGLVS